jgi:hypothetical protein
MMCGDRTYISSVLPVNHPDCKCFKKSLKIEPNKNRRYRILDISVPGHFGTDLDISVLGTDLDISVLGTGQFGTFMRQYSVLTTFVWYLLIVNIFVLVVLLIEFKNF